MPNNISDTLNLLNLMIADLVNINLMSILSYSLKRIICAKIFPNGTIAEVPFIV